jgi:hypothetical protein
LAPVHDLSCVLHLHSLHSDGTGTVPEIARAAAAAGIRVVLLTDHDTLAARERGEERWYGDVLVLVGEEVSPKGRNHYLAFGADRHVRHRGLSGDQICRAVRERGGFGFAAHPFSQGSRRFRAARGIPFDALDCDALHGVELWSIVTDTAERLDSIPAALRFIATPRRVVDHPPARNLAEWDRLCARRRTVAVGGIDAHQFGRRIGPVAVRLMSYRRSFALLQTHVLCAEPVTGELDHDRAQVLDALREGRCYLAVDWIAPPSGFELFAERDGERLEMGSEAGGGGWTVRARLPAEADLRLLRDGAPVHEAHASELVHDARAPGAYRLEAHRTARGRVRTWILSNPVYLR